MAYQFPSELDRFVKDELARGHYESEDELVTDAVRLPSDANEKKPSPASARASRT